MRLVRFKRDLGDMQFERSRESQVPENRRGAIDTIIKKEDDFEHFGIQGKTV